MLIDPHGPPPTPPGAPSVLVLSQSSNVAAQELDKVLTHVHELPSPIEEVEDDTYSDYTSIKLASAASVKEPCIVPPSLPPSVNAALGIARSISNALSDPTINSIFQHFIGWTCPSLDPGHLKMAENNSIRYYLPIAVNSPSCFHGLLALSSMQLREANPAFAQNAIRHRSLSLRHLNREIQDKKHIYDPTVLAGILCQLTLDVMEAKSAEWRAHLNICRSTAKRLLQDSSEYVIWFVACRIAKYDTFASLIDAHQPIIPINSLENKELAGHFDVLWGIPATWCVYSATLTYWGTMPDSAQKQTEMELIESKIESCMPFIDDPTRTLEEQVEVVWHIATFIHYTRITSSTRLDLIPAVRSAFSVAIGILTAFPSGDFKGTAFSWPLFVLMTAAFTPDERETLEHTIAMFWRMLRISTFGQILKISESLWAVEHEKMSGPEYASEIQGHLKILLA